MNTRIRIAFLIIFSSLVTVILTRLIAIASIDDYGDYDDLGKLALLTVIFFLVVIMLNTPLFFYLFKNQVLSKKPTKINYFVLFIIGFTFFALSTFSFDWLFDIVIESDTSKYYGYLLLQSMKGNTEETRDLLLDSPFLIKNYVVNILGIIISWIICALMARRASRTFVYE